MPNNSKLNKLQRCELEDLIWGLAISAKECQERMNAFLERCGISSMNEISQKDFQRVLPMARWINCIYDRERMAR